MPETGKWSTSKPTAAGWYWNRINGTVGIALIMRRDCQLYAWLRFKDAWLSREGWLDYIHGEWLGPITPDSYQQGRVAGLREAGEAYVKWASNDEYRKDWPTFDAWCRWMAQQQAQDEKEVGDDLFILP